MKRTILFVFSLLLLLSSCRKSPNHINIDLHNQPLDVVMANIIGNWKLVYMIGGIEGDKYTDKYNNTLSITPDQFSMGNDLTPIRTWDIDMQKIMSVDTYFYIFYGTDKTTNQTTPKYQVEKIVNDTLITRDYNIFDGFNYYYVKK